MRRGLDRRGRSAPAAHRSAPVVAPPSRAPVVVIASDDNIDAAFDAGAVDCIATRCADRRCSRAYARRWLRAERTRRSSRERKLSEEIKRSTGERRSRATRVRRFTDRFGKSPSRADLLVPSGSVGARQGADVGRDDRSRLLHKYNERYGHPAVTAACAASRGDVGCLRAVGFSRRYGGENFSRCYRTPMRPARDSSRADVPRVEDSDSASNLECSRVVTISAGFASYQATVERTVDVLVGAADNALCARRPRAAIRPARGAAILVRRTGLAGSMDAYQSSSRPVFVDRIPQFLAETGEEAADLKAQANDDFDRFDDRASPQSERTRLQLRTDRQLASLIEHCARFEDREAIREATDELEEYVTHVQVTYRRPLEQAS